MNIKGHVQPGYVLDAGSISDLLPNSKKSNHFRTWLWRGSGANVFKPPGTESKLIWCGDSKKICGFSSN